MSQLNVDNNLYLCGSEEGANKGSFFLKLDNTKSLTSTVSIMINAQHSHVYPSMISMFIYSEGSAIIKKTPKIVMRFYD